jgi:hypothetical protein
MKCPNCQSEIDLDKHEAELKTEIDLWKRQAAFESEHREKYRNRVQPLVDALERLRDRIKQAHGLPNFSIVEIALIDDALAKAKERK